MPADLPTTPEQWAAITEKRIHSDYELTQSWLKSDGAPHNGLDLAAASRIAEHERCVEKLARGMCYRRGLVPMLDGHIAMTIDEPCEKCRRDARLELEDVAEPAGPA